MNTETSLAMMQVKFRSGIGSGTVTIALGSTQQLHTTQMLDPECDIQNEDKM